MSLLDFVQNQSKVQSNDLKKAFSNAIVEQGLPTKKTELWRYNSLNALGSNAWQPAQKDSAINPYWVNKITEWSALHAVWVNGKLRPLNDTLKQSLQGEAKQQNYEIPSKKLGNQVWNTAFQDFSGLLGKALSTDTLKITHGTGASVICIWNFFDGEQGTIAGTDQAFFLDENTEYTIVEIFAPPACSEALLPKQASNIHALWAHDTKITMGAHARVKHILIDLSPIHCFQMHTVNVSVASGGRYESYIYQFGSAQSRTQVDVDLNGEGAFVKSMALMHPHQDQNLALYSRIRHRSRHTGSEQLVKQLVDNHGMSAFSGKIDVPENVGRIEAHQLNRNLMLSEKGTAIAVPQLEIRSDDVACTHGSSTANLSSEELFYLRSRGFSLPMAYKALQTAFVGEVTHAMPEGPWKNFVSHTLLGELSEQDI